MRLAYNQAERLVKNLVVLAAQPGGPRFTVSLQSNDVSRHSHQPATYQGRQPVLWETDAACEFEFPLFGCPDCGKRLRVGR